MADNATSSPAKPGKVLLTEEDFAPLYDSEGNEVGSVPKHWADTELPPGTSRKKPSKG